MKRKNNTLMQIVAACALLLVATVTACIFFLRPVSVSSSALPPLDQDGVQEVRMSINGLTYNPDVITVQAGTKVRWIIDSSRAQGCARTLYSKTLGINQILQSTTTTIEFTPTRTGRIDFSCTMGMARGQFQVV